MKAREAHTLKGRGSDSARVRLSRGGYKLEYRFPPEVLCAVRLVSGADAQDVFLLVKSGQGEAAFHIDSDGRYVLSVEPADEQARWQLELRPLGLPSGLAPYA